VTGVPSGNVLLRVDAVSKTFGGIAAVNEVSLVVGPGQRVQDADAQVEAVENGVAA